MKDNYSINPKRRFKVKAFIERKKAEWNTPEAKIRRELLVNSIVVGVTTSVLSAAIVAGTGLVVSSVANKAGLINDDEEIEEV